MNVHFCLDGGDGFFHLGHEVFVWPFDGGDDAEFRGPGFCGLFGCFHQTRDVQPGGAHGGFKQAGLRAEVTIFRAAAGFEGDDSFYFHFFTAPGQAHFVCQGEEVLEVVVG